MDTLKNSNDQKTLACLKLVSDPKIRPFQWILGGFSMSSSFDGLEKKASSNISRNGALKWYKNQSQLFMMFEKGGHVSQTLEFRNFGFFFSEQWLAMTKNIKKFLWDSSLLVV